MRSLLLGGAIYGIAILVMHFTAMGHTGFVPLAELQPTVRMVPNDTLAMLVIFAAFLICGSFLLTTATLRGPLPSETPAPWPVSTETAPEAPLAASTAPPIPTPRTNRLPYEQDGRTYFVAVDDVVAVQADGHYTRLHRVSGPAFCPQPITKLTEELSEGPFLRTHRSYLVNMNYVQGFERKKDQAVCHFAPEIGVEPVPVSRANVAAIKEALGL